MDDNLQPLFNTDQLSEIRERALEFAEIGTFRYRMDGTIVYMDKGAMNALDLGHLYSDPTQIVGRNIKDLLIYIQPEGSLRKNVIKNR